VTAAAAAVLTVEERLDRAERMLAVMTACVGEVMWQFGMEDVDPFTEQGLEKCRAAFASVRDEVVSTFPDVLGIGYGEDD
jgi:hypothetical protein